MSNTLLPTSVFLTFIPTYLWKIDIIKSDLILHKESDVPASLWHFVTYLRGDGSTSSILELALSLASVAHFGLIHHRPFPRFESHVYLRGTTDLHCLRILLSILQRCISIILNSRNIFFRVMCVFHFRDNFRDQEVVGKYFLELSFNCFTLDSRKSVEML